MSRRCAVFLLFSGIIFCSRVLRAEDLSSDQKTFLIQKLDTQWERSFTPELKARYDLRNVAEFALDAVSVGYRHDRIEAALTWLKKDINTDRNSKTYGNIFWYHGDRTVTDVNAVEFCMRHASLIWILYRDRLNDNEKRTLSEIYDLSIQGITRHSVKLSYTNIILMKIWNLVALGDYYNRPDLSAMGYSLLGEWIEYVKKYGIYEYLSPTYYGVDVENLSLLVNFAKNPGGRKIAAAGLEYIWTDIIVNWYRPSERLGGTHSRDYDRLYGHADVDRLMARAGLLSRNDIRLSDQSVYAKYSFVPPSAAAKKWISASVPRFVSEKWGEEPFQRACQYIGTDFSIASSESNYFNMDKTPLVISLGSGYDTPVINYFMDARSDYYGFARILEKSGHMKSLHLRPFLWSVQNDNEVLFVSSSRDDTEKYSKLESVFTLPSDAEYWIDNRKLDIFNSRSSWHTNPEANNTSTFLKVKDTDGVPVLDIKDNDTTAGIGIQKTIKVTPGEKYRLRALMKGGSISLYLNFFDSRNMRIGEEHIRSFRPGTSAFSWYENVEAAPSGSATCVAWIYSSRSSMTDTFIRDMKIEEMNGSKMRPLGSFDFREFIPQSFSLSAGQNLYVKRENCVAVIRILEAEDVNGKEIKFELNNDGLNYGAFRLSASHSVTRTGRRGSVVAWARVENGISDEKKFELMRARIGRYKGSAELKGSTLSASIKGGTGELTLSVDVADEKRLSRKGEKVGDGSALLLVDGTDIGKKILEGISGIAIIGNVREP